MGPPTIVGGNGTERPKLSAPFFSQKGFSIWQLQITRDTDGLITTVLEQADVAFRLHVRTWSRQMLPIMLPGPTEAAKRAP